MSDNYEDIIDLPHPVSFVHPPMPRRDRAAQFSPFAALTGYDKVIEETGRETCTERIPDEQRKSELDRCFYILKKNEAAAPEVCITLFVPDERKEGGEYVTLISCVRKVDEMNRKLLLCSGESIDMSDIWDIQSNILDNFGR